MEFGVLLGDVPASLDPSAHLDQLLRQVEAAQRNGFTLITIGQHFLYGDVRWLQPIPTLARLSAELDSTVRLATTVLVAPLHHPVLLAEELATLDIMTGGRLTVGLGIGYREEEYRQIGVQWDERVTRFEEMLLLLRALWTEPAVTYTGRHWSLDGATPHIQPAQKPTPPVWIGGMAEAAIRRSARLGDAWPIGPRMPVDQMRRMLDVYYAERDRLRLARSAQPIRREIVLGRDLDDAHSTYLEMTGERNRGYATRERSTLPGSVAAGNESATAVLGNAADVTDALTALAADLPIGPVIVRVQWPGMDADAVSSYLDALGSQVVEPLRALASRSAESYSSQHVETVAALA